MYNWLFRIIIVICVCFCLFTGFSSTWLTVTKSYSQNTFSINDFIKIKQRNPVVNEGNQIVLSVINPSGQQVSDITWTSGSPDIATVDKGSGQVQGVKQGSATITAHKGSESTSVFVVVARVGKGKRGQVSGDTKTDTSGHLYISDPKKNIILRASTVLSAPLEVYSGRPQLAGKQDGNRENALFAGPTAIALDNSVKGGVYISDTLNHSIRKIGFNDQVETLLGVGSPTINTFGSDGVMALSRLGLNSPRGLAVDSGGNLYVSDTDSHAIYYVDFTHQQVLLLAGSPGESGQKDGQGQEARFKRPSGMALSPDGRVLTVADEDNNRVRIIEIIKNANGRIMAEVSTLSAASNVSQLTFSQTNSFSKEEPLEPINFNKPQFVSFDAVGNIYTVDNTGVRLVTQPLSLKPEVVDLAQPDISFNQPVSVVIEGNQAFVFDNGAPESESIKLVSVGAPEINTISPSTLPLSGNVEVVISGTNFAPETIVTFGGKVIKGINVVSATEIRFIAPVETIPGTKSLTLLTRGGIVQKELSVVAKPAEELSVGEITTIAGGATSLGDGGLATKSSLLFPNRMVLDSANNLFIADTVNERVRRVDGRTGIIATIAGGGILTKDGELAIASRIMPDAIALDNSGNIFITDRLTQSVRRIDSLTNTITTVAIIGKPLTLLALTLDTSGHIYVGVANQLLKIDGKTNAVSVFAGNGQSGSSGDGGLAINAAIGEVQKVIIDSLGNFYILSERDFTGTFRTRVRQVDPKGIITTVAGNGKR
ncbi:MAG: NHL repeat containing protein, partial [bacterium]